MKNINNQRLKAGIERMKEKKYLILIPLIFIAFMIFSLFASLELIKKMGNPYSEKVYIIIVYVVFSLMIVIGIVGIMRSFGKPLVSKRIEGELVDIGFVDNEGQSPILLSKKKENNGFILEFFSTTIPLCKYENHISEIETALNIKAIDVLPGKDMQHTKIKAISGNNGKQGTILWDDEFIRSKDFELVLGESYFGIECIDISTTPHVLIGGGSGSGKSKLLKLLLMESIKKKAIIYLADFKGGIDYPTVWHNACSIITEPDMLDSTLDCILKILEERRTMLIESGYSNIAEYNIKTDSDVHRIIVACDEIAEVLDKTGLEKEQKALVNRIESKFSTIARLGRAFGIHLVFATQRPDADILKGQIKNNIGYRICGRADKVLSQIILDNSNAADKITPNDQGMFLTNTGKLFKAYYVNDNCLEGVDYNGKTANQR